MAGDTANWYTHNTVHMECIHLHLLFWPSCHCVIRIRSLCVGCVSHWELQLNFFPESFLESICIPAVLLSPVIKCCCVILLWPTSHADTFPLLTHKHCTHVRAHVHLHRWDTHAIAWHLDPGQMLRHSYLKAEHWKQWRSPSLFSQLLFSHITLSSFLSPPPLDPWLSFALLQSLDE